MDLKLLSIVAIMHLAALASPGPDFTLVIRTSLNHTRKAAFAAVLGISVAIFVHTILSLSGISILIQKNETLYTFLQIIGCTYLGWIGLDLLKNGIQRKGSSIITTVIDKTNKSSNLVKKAFLRGFVSNIFNPKVLIFFISLLSTLVTQEYSLSFRVVLTLQIFVMCFIWFAMVVALFSNVRVQQKFGSLKWLVDIISGVLFLVFAIVILLRI